MTLCCISFAADKELVCLAFASALQYTSSNSTTHDPIIEAKVAQIISSFL